MYVVPGTLPSSCVLLLANQYLKATPITSPKYDTLQSLNTSEGEMHITSFGKGNQGMCMEIRTEVSLVTWLVQTHISTYVMLSRDPSHFSFGRRGGEPRRAYDMQLLGGGTPKLEVKTHTHMSEGNHGIVTTKFAVTVPSTLPNGYPSANISPGRG
jgi:hypothetical protein